MSDYIKRGINWFALERSIDAALLDFRAEVQSASAGNPAKRKARLQHGSARTRNEIINAARQALSAPNTEEGE